MSQEVVTFGCRLNIYESEVIKEALKDSGTEDVIVFNTCTVTKEAERQAKQAIRKAKKLSPHKKIIVTGCAAQVNPAIFSSMPEVDKVIGNEEKLKSDNYKIDPFTLNEEKVVVNDIMSVKETALHLISSFEGKARAFIQVQNGCNHRCTFCIIPYGRGNSRSVPIGEIVAQVRTLVASGYNEIVLTGVDVSDYGLDLPGQPSLGQMMRRLLALVPELPRLRLSSIDVAEIDEDLFNLLAVEKRIMPHVHISLQAGDNLILKRMKRRHNREQVIEFCHKLRKLRPEVAYGADIIAGFPTETEEMFQNTLNIVEEAGLQYLHVFPYSEREGTPASRMPQVAKHIRKERAQRLREKGEKHLIEFLNKCINNPMQVIVEKENLARGENFATVLLDKSATPGQILNVKIKGREGLDLVGEVIG
jgi:threonylcarbamoyladenosine tRNA methylthiotransferase MtaB